LDPRPWAFGLVGPWDCSSLDVSRDHRKLHVFKMADELAFDIYRSTQEFPSGERFGLQSQLRRAAISVASNIVEGSARRYPAEYRSFINIGLRPKA